MSTLSPISLKTGRLSRNPAPHPPVSIPVHADFLHPWPTLYPHTSRRPAAGTPVPSLRPWAVLLALCSPACSGCGESPTANPFENEQRIDAGALESAYAGARAIPGSFSLLVQRNGILVAEEYFHGFTPDSLHDVRSVTKSVISALVGIAIEEGFLPSADEPIGEYLTPVVDSIREEVAGIPIRSFLMMSSGLDWHELDRGSSYSDWWASDDMVQHVVDLPVVHEPPAPVTSSPSSSPKPPGSPPWNSPKRIFSIRWASAAPPGYRRTVDTTPGEWASASRHGTW